MKTQALSSLLISAALAIPGAAMAQSSTPAPARAASAPASPAASSVPGAASPKARAEARTEAAEERMRAMPDSGRDSVNSVDKGAAGTAVVPQFSIPFGKTPPPAEGAVTGTGNSIDDSAARCEAQKDAQMRAKCRADAKARPAAPR
jgi:hypothetical protein